MNKNTLAFIALAITMLYGVGFAVIDEPRGYAVMGGVLVSLSWIAVGVFGRETNEE